MVELEWTQNETGATAELDWLSIWIEPLDREGEGRFVWTVDTPVAGYAEELMLVRCGVERSLAAAKDASREAAIHLIAMDVGKEAANDAWRN